jgi:hypothetical protein
VIAVVMVVLLLMNSAIEQIGDFVLKLRAAHIRTSPSVSMR